MPMDRKVYLVDAQDEQIVKMIKRWWKRVTKRYSENKIIFEDLPRSFHIRYLLNPSRMIKNRVIVNIDIKKGSFSLNNRIYPRKLIVEVVTSELSSVLHTSVSGKVYRYFERNFQKEGIVWEVSPGILHRIIKMIKRKGR